MDAFSFTRWRRIVLFAGWGATACLTALCLVRLVEWHQVWVSPVVEESLKSLPAIYLIHHKSHYFKIAFFAEALVYGMAIGAGFSLVENTLYTTYNPDLTIVEGIVRGFGTSLIHMGCTAFLATCQLTASRIAKLPAAAGMVLSMTMVSGIHTFYNLFLLPPFIQSLIIIAVFMLLFLGIYHVEEHLIYSWLDAGITDDVRMLGAIRQGKMASTHAGEYLAQLRKSFHPEVFFDMCVYYQLYLELSVHAKSRLILRNAGMDTPLTPQQHADNLERLTELRALHHRLGNSCLTAMAPLTHASDTDQWVLNELL